MATKNTTRTKAAAAAPVAQDPLKLDDMAITLKVEENPKRVGSGAYKRFKLYREGMKVPTYIKRVGDRTKAVADLKWDQLHGFIELTRSAGRR